MRIVVAGGGIAGLTFAAAARRLGLHCTVVEQANDLLRLNAGSGLGLWPNSMACLDVLGVTQQLEAQGAWMPSVAYQRADGTVLARPSSLFSARFPVLCLHRDRLQRILFEACVKDNAGPTVKFMTGVSVSKFESDSKGVRVFLNDNSFIDADALVGADGIHSAVRNQLVPNVREIDCGYVYFRATLDVTEHNVGLAPHSRAFEAWGNGRRFGYVPLREPEVFWFASIPIQDRNRSALTAEATKQWLLELFDGWMGPWKDDQQLVNLQQLIACTPASSILRTTIRKIPNVEKFPWYGGQGRVILLGDSAHATAPNLAQGAGLAIEDAIVLANGLGNVARGDVTFESTAKDYESSRKPRARTVQTLADLVAMVGQLRAPVSTARDVFMLTSKLVPRLQSHIFERTVSFSLGGDASSLTWRPPLPKGTIDEQALVRASERRCFLGSILGTEFSKLPPHIKAFRVSPFGEGTGRVSVELGRNFLVRIFARIMRLPKDMKDQPFAARVETRGTEQLWTRTFGGGPSATVFSTSHKLARSGGQIALTEGAGGVLDKFFRFHYYIHMKTFHTRPAIVSYTSRGFRFCGLPIPSLLCPHSHWMEEATENGWMFDGDIQLPVLGRLMHYFGQFCIPGLQESPQIACGRVVIAGGSGLLGTVLSERFARAGWEVVVLSRSGRGPSNCKVVVWDGHTATHWADLVDSSTVLINLSGENPGAKRWNTQFKSKIESSRLEAISAMAAVIKARKPRLFLQASAAGIYGDRGDEPLGDNATPSHANTFRESCTRNLEDAAIKSIEKTDVPLKLLRLGHLLSRQGGLLPYLEIASRCGTSRLGSGTQYIPWIHIHDAAEAIVSLASEDASLASQVCTYNICSPNPVTNAEFFRVAAQIRGRLNAIPVPAWILRSAIGESYSVILDSQRTIPERLLGVGFEFTYPNLEEALSVL